jgi:site-specific DNA recombinase
MNAAIYVRVSTVGQETDGTSLGTQERACREYAEAHGYQVAGVFREVFSGAELRERPRLSELREAVRRGEVEAIVAYAVDRLSREQAHLYILDDECERAGVAMLFVTEEFDKTPVGKIIRSVKAFAAELEREKIRERTVRGMIARAEAGYHSGRGRALYGYRYADERRRSLVIDPATAPTVREIYRRIDGGESLRKVASDLTARGVPTPTGNALWRHTTLRAILSHPGYIGQGIALRRRCTRKGGHQRQEFRPEEETIALPEGVFPPLVDRETFARAQARLQRNRVELVRQVTEPERFLLRAGFVVCGRCGHTLSATWKDGAHTGGRYPVYLAGRNHRGCAPGLATFSIKAEVLDAAAWGKVEEYLLNPGRFAARLAGRDDRDPAAERLADVERLLADVKRQQGNLAAAIGRLGDPEASAPLEAQLQALAGTRRGLAAERDDLLASRAAWQIGQERQHALIDWWCNAAAAIGDFNYHGKRDALAMLGIKARVWPGGQYDIVTPPEPPGSCPTNHGVVLYAALIQLAGSRDGHESVTGDKHPPGGEK